MKAIEYLMRVADEMMYWRTQATHDVYEVSIPDMKVFVNYSGIYQHFSEFGERYDHRVGDELPKDQQYIGHTHHDTGIVEVIREFEINDVNDIIEYLDMEELMKVLLKEIQTELHLIKGKSS